SHPFFGVGDERLALMLAHRQTVADRQAIDLALDREDLVDAADRFDRQGCLSEIGHLEEMAPAMAPARRLGDRPWFALAVIELAKPGISVGLEDAVISGKMPRGVLAVSVARVIKDCRRRVRPGERPVVAHISP